MKLNGNAGSLGSATFPIQQAISITKSRCICCPILLSIASILAIDSNTLAQSELENVTIAPSSSGVNGTLTFDVPQFDSSLGSLNSVELTLTPSIGGFGNEISFITGSPEVATGLSVGKPSGSLTDSAIGLTSTYSSSETETSKQINVPAGEGLIMGPNLFVPPDFYFSLGSVSVGPTGFVGSGFNDLTFTGNCTATVTGSGNGLGVSYWGSIGGSLAIEYDYTVASVPEPTTITLLAGGLLGALTLPLRKFRGG